MEINLYEAACKALKSYVLLRIERLKKIPSQKLKKFLEILEIQINFYFSQ